MAIVCLDGFETGTVQNNVATNGDSWSVVGGYDGIGRALTSDSTNIFTTGRHVFKRFTSGTDTIYGHMSVYPTNFSGAGTGHEGSVIFTVFTDIGATQHLNAQFDNAGHLVLRRGDAEGTPVLQTSTETIPAVAAWRSLQFKVTIHDTAGECIIMVDGIEFINFTGDTRNAGGSTRPDAVGIRSKLGQNRIDDVLICDTTGSINNSWPGQISIAGVRPAGNGAHSGLTGSDGDSTDNYLLVDEYPFNTTDYAASGVVGVRDTYDMSPVGKVGTVVGVQSYVYAGKSDAGTRLFKHVRRNSAGALSVSADAALSTTWLLYAGPVWETQSTGAPWSIAAVDSHEFGFEVA